MIEISNISKKNYTQIAQFYTFNRCFKDDVLTEFLMSSLFSSFKMDHVLKET